jgi:hypothetical protein
VPSSLADENNDVSHIHPPVINPTTPAAITEYALKELWLELMLEGVVN